MLRSLVHHCRIAQQELASSLVMPGLSLPAAPSGASGSAAGGFGSTMGGGTSGTGGLYFMSALSAAQREAGNLADACDRFAMEARRLGTPECEALAGQLDGVKRQVLEQLGGGVQGR